MSDNANQPPKASSLSVLMGETLEGFLATVGGALKKNIVISVGRLAMDITDLGSAYVQKHTRAIRAATSAQEMLTASAAKQIAKRMDVPPEYVKVATDKVFDRIVEKQSNLDGVVGHAMVELQSAPVLPAGHRDVEPEEISVDWLNVFEGQAQNASSEEMRRRFGRVLAGEIRRPGSFSFRALKIMGELDNRTAILFAKLCAIATACAHEGFSGYSDVRAFDLGNRAGYNGLAAYGLNFRALSELQEYGLVISDLHSSLNVGDCIAVDGKVANWLVFAGTPYGLVADEPHALRVQLDLQDKLDFGGVAFTAAGRELFSIVEATPHEQYFQDFKAFLSTLRLSLDTVVIKS